VLERSLQGLTEAPAWDSGSGDRNVPDRLASAPVAASLALKSGTAWRALPPRTAADTLDWHRRHRSGPSWRFDSNLTANRAAGRDVLGWAIAIRSERVMLLVVGLQSQHSKQEGRMARTMPQRGRQAEQRRLLEQAQREPGVADAIEAYERVASLTTGLRREVTTRYSTGGNFPTGQPTA